MEVLARTFARPPDFDLKQHLEHSLGIYQSDAPLTDVRIWFSSDVARYVTEHRWHHSQQIEEQPDGSLIVDLKLSDLTELKSWILSFGANARALAPNQLVLEVREEFEAAISQYQAVASEESQIDLHRVADPSKEPTGANVAGLTS